MSFSHPFKRVCPNLCIVALAVVPAICAASSDGPPAVIAGLAGQWTGESTQTLGGLATTEISSNARRYWIEGSIVRGEILSSAGGKLETARVAILPRDFGFVKILTLEGNAPEMFVGTPSEGGILWSAASSDRIRYIERVMGEGDDRRLEVLLVEASGEQPKVIETLLPSEDALTGVIGAEIQSVEEIEPLVLPPQPEMQMLDRIGQLTKQRDEAQIDSGSTARELAAAWRQSEELEAKLAEQSKELAQSSARLKSATEGKDADAIEARLHAAESDLTEARRWADNLEKSLREETARADAAATRVETLEKDLTDLTGERDQLNSQVARQSADAAAALSQQGELQSSLDAEVEKRAAVEKTLAEVQARVETLGEENQRLSADADELKQARDQIAALNQSIAELEGRFDETVPAAEAANQKQELDAAVAELAEANAKITELQKDLTVATDEKQKQAHDLDALREQLAGGIEERDQVRQQLDAALARVESEQANREQLETSVAELPEAQARIGELEEKISALEQAARDAEEFSAAAVAARESAELEAKRVQEELNAVNNTLAGLEAEMADLRSASDAIPAVAETGDNRVEELETRLAETFARSEQRQQEIETLNSNIAGLEAENKKLATRVADLAARIAAERPEDGTLAGHSALEEIKRQLADKESARLELEAANQSLAVQLREKEIELAEAKNLENQPATAPPSPAVVSNQAVAPASEAVEPSQPEKSPVVAFDTRSAPQESAETTTPAPQPAEVAGESTVSFQPPAVRPSSAPQSGRQPPRRPDESQAASFYPSSTAAGTAGQNPFLVQVVRGLPVNGFRRAAADSLVVINGRTYRIGQIVDAEHGLTFKRIDSDSIVFSGPDGGDYRFGL